MDSAAGRIWRGPGDIRDEMNTNWILLAAMPAVVIRQRKAWRRRDGVFLYFEVRIPIFLIIFGSHPLVGQRRCYCQPQGRDEGFCHYWPRGQGMRASTLVTVLSGAEADRYFWLYRPISGPVSPQTLVPWFERFFPPFSLSSCSLHSCNSVT